jgi:signal peptidase II
VTTPSPISTTDAPPTPPAQPPALDAHSDGGAARSPRAVALLAIVTLVALAIDLVSKYLAFHYVAGAPVTVSREEVLALAAQNPRFIQSVIPPHPPVPVVPGLLDFTLVLNPGAVFGMGAGKRIFFIAFTGVAISFALWMFHAWTRPRDRAAHIALALLIAGGLGNLYDRIVYACVRDFIHPLPGVQLPFGWTLMGSRDVWPWVSNVADLFLLIGIGTLAIFLLRRDRALRRAGVA